MCPVIAVTLKLTYKETLSELQCIVHGVLISSLKWTRDGVLLPTISFTQSQLYIDKITATTTSIIYSDFVNFVGEFECVVTDNNGETYSSQLSETTQGIQFNISLCITFRPLLDHFSQIL